MSNFKLFDTAQRTRDARVTLPRPTIAGTCKRKTEHVDKLQEKKNTVQESQKINIRHGTLQKGTRYSFTQVSKK